MNLLVILALVAAASCAEHLLPKKSVAIDKNSVLVLFGTRHGNRHPEVFLEENPRSWGYEGNTELTSYGKRQGLGLGKELRSFVGKLISRNYNSSQVKYYSSSANRCQMTLQTVTAALHDPEQWGDWDKKWYDHWSPVPYAIDDPLLRMYAVKECKGNDKVWGPIDKDSLPTLKKLKTSNSAELKYFADNTKWNMGNLGKAADLADNLIEIDLYKAEYPSWIKSPKLKGYTFEKLKAKILEFAEVHQNACAEYGPCGNLMAGYWLQNLLDKVADANAGKGPQVIGYASHTEITLSVMKLMGYVKDELTTSAGFVVEFKRLPKPAVRLLNHDPNPIDEHVIYPAELTPKLKKLADKDGFIPLDGFTAFAKQFAFSDWKSQCDKA
ncbi:hypothetical protein L5515_010989 [Caenorhabditis briggsae]|uniref:Uncharacterized protein n=2 Tax=Caenorhabditis briggsae TaxID=6238 RepID=A0AAE9AAF1_CAEBR|nr:hypothetical protein L3Y34_003860 [Caenorhabditis briggsae]UMM27917.1 hypothetical protein L5515_010989 [Caenorhabditis briggsae]